MDGLTALLDGPRARSAFLLRCVMSPPWAIRVQDEAPLSVVALVRGDAWLLRDDGRRRQVRAGQVVLLRGPDPYVFADDPGTAVQAVIEPGQVCLTPDGRSLEAALDLGVRTWGNDLDGPVMMLTGTYDGDGEVGRRLLAALPPVVVLDADRTHSPVVALLAAEVDQDRPGQQVVLDRLLDLLVIETVRGWCASAEGPGPSWYAAHADPVVGPALRLLHNDPAAPWTVVSLAAATGVSRAAFARRFSDLVGEPPMSYLAGWRLALAADLLREPHTTVAAAARQVGYGSPFTFSAAFKRRYGVSPKAYRNRGDDEVATSPGA